MIKSATLWPSKNIPVLFNSGSLIRTWVLRQRYTTLFFVQA